MPATGRTYSSRDFNQDIAGAKRDAREGPVIVTDRGEPAFVLMTHAHYAAMARHRKTLLDLCADPDPETDFDFEIDRSDFPEPKFLDVEAD